MAGTKNPHDHDTHDHDPLVNPAVSHERRDVNVFQISAKQLQPAGVARVRAALQSRYGLSSFDSTSVGPTFGKTVANSAVVAISDKSEVNTYRENALAGSTPWKSCPKAARVALKLRLPSRPSRVASSISTSPGELARVGT